MVGEILGTGESVESPLNFVSCMFLLARCMGFVKARVEVARQTTVSKMPTPGMRRLDSLIISKRGQTTSDS